MEVDALTLAASCRDEGSDEHGTSKGEDHRRRVRRLYALSLRLDRGAFQVPGAKYYVGLDLKHRVGIEPP